MPGRRTARNVEPSKHRSKVKHGVTDIVVFYLERERFSEYRAKPPVCKSFRDAIVS
ncbi:hypothetical protein CKA32_000013 [Geitlerinema sp. FC II]|nr:hypothetical protein CKA32_000013 [Geitlerinema sp. FC II]